MASRREVKIFCPRCAWTPRASSRWMCDCRCVWNTFDTGGVCPDCGKAWTRTQCLDCKQFSPHADWYHELIADGITAESAANLPEPAR